MAEPTTAMEAAEKPSENGHTPQSRRRFSTKRHIEAIEIEDDHGNVNNYVIKEMMGPVRESFMAEAADRMTFSADGKVARMKNFKGVFVSLIKRCLFREDGTTPVPELEINSWPTTAQEELFHYLRTINGLEDEKSKEEVKND